MPNSNYRAGRRIEYEVKKVWEQHDYKVIRASGSHGEYDLIAYRQDRKPEFIQCKRVTTEAQADKLLTEFKKETIPSGHYHQGMWIKVKGQRGFERLTV
jgi:hypothetical protein